MRPVFGATILALLIGMVLPALTAEPTKKADPKSAKPKYNKVLRGDINLEGEKGLTFRVGARGQWVEVKTAEDVKIRIPMPPPQFDDKGKPKKYTEKEKKELKGPGNLPGYTGDYGDLKSGQIVDIYLNVPKPTTKKKKKDDEDTDEAKPVITMIVILAEPRR